MSNELFETLSQVENAFSRPAIEIQAEYQKDGKEKVGVALELIAENKQAFETVMANFQPFTIHGVARSGSLEDGSPHICAWSCEVDNPQVMPVAIARLLSQTASFKSMKVTDFTAGKVTRIPLSNLYESWDGTSAGGGGGKWSKKENESKANMTTLIAKDAPKAKRLIKATIDGAEFTGVSQRMLNWLQVQLDEIS